MDTQIKKTTGGNKQVQRRFRPKQFMNYLSLKQKLFQVFVSFTDSSRETHSCKTTETLKQLTSWTKSFVLNQETRVNTKQWRSLNS